MSESMKAMFEKLPIYWKLITFNALIYATISMLTTVIAGLQGYEHWSDITPLGHLLLIFSAIVSFLNTIKAFLDTTIQKIQPSTNLPNGTAEVKTTTITEVGNKTS